MARWRRRIRDETHLKRRTFRRHGGEPDDVAEIDCHAIEIFRLYLVPSLQLFGHVLGQHFVQQRVWFRAKNTNTVLRFVRNLNYDYVNIISSRHVPVFFFSSTSWSVRSSTSTSKLFAYFSIIAIMLSNMFGLLKRVRQTCETLVPRRRTRTLRGSWPGD